MNTFSRSCDFDKKLNYSFHFFLKNLEQCNNNRWLFSDSLNLFNHYIILIIYPLAAVFENYAAPKFTVRILLNSYNL